MKFSGLAVLALSVLFAGSSYADPVHLETGGNLFGEPPLGAGQEYEFGFTLSSDTQVTALHFGIFSSFLGHSTFGSYSITLTGPGGTVYWYDLVAPVGGTTQAIPSLLPAGSYQVTYDGISCTDPCINNTVAGMDYYRPATYTQIGGSVLPGLGLGDGLGWYLIGDTASSSVSAVPEPGTVTLVGSGLLAAFAGLRRRSLNA